LEKWSKIILIKKKEKTNSYFKFIFYQFLFIIIFKKLHFKKHFNSNYINLCSEISVLFIIRFRRKMAKIK